MTELGISARTSAMGRPKMGVKLTMVRLPEGVPERIDALAGKNRRAEFIRDAVEKELRRREKEGEREKKPAVRADHRRSKSREEAT